MVSAPGKVIVYGEHAVVHGKTAIAAALSLRCYLLVTPLPKTAHKLTLRFPDIGLDHSWDIELLPWDMFSAPGKKKYYFDTVERLDNQLMNEIKPLIADIPGKVLQASAVVFLYLYLMLGSKHAPASIYTLRSTIPIGAGLGSSASISVCLSTALQLQMGTLTTPFNGMTSNETQLQLKRINNWAFVGEMCIHGNPSGVDNTVATGGKAVLFKRMDYSLPPQVTHISNFPELPFLLVNTKQPRRTSEQVANVHSLLSAHPEITNSLFDTIDRITLDAHRIISNPEFSAQPGSLDLLQLGELIRINHGLLVSLGVSHPKLERIRELIDYTGIGWTKLTGAGGGGCSITLMKQNVKQSVLDDLDTKLSNEGFEKYKTTLGGAGVGVLWPAITKTDREVEITQDMFLAADGVEGVEDLVGVGAIGRGDQGWRFWREWIPEESEFTLH
ncbi:ribosomal protein S5 domain 2-type protein [Morchella snyderi]|nr:ribosomal protein S5 domain 2-type protein [Morchella snyderi]